MLSLSIILIISAVISVVFGIKTVNGKGKAFVFVGILLAVCAAATLFVKETAFAVVLIAGIAVKLIVNSLNVKCEG